MFLNILSVCVATFALWEYPVINLRLYFYLILFLSLYFYLFLSLQLFLCFSFVALSLSINFPVWCARFFYFFWSATIFQYLRFNCWLFEIFCYCYCSCCCVQVNAAIAIWMDFVFSFVCRCCTPFYLRWKTTLIASNQAKSHLNKYTRATKETCQHRHLQTTKYAVVMHTTCKWWLQLQQLCSLKQKSK